MVSDKQLFVDFIVVRESTGEKFREKVESPSCQNLEIKLSDRIRNMLDSEDREDIFRDLSRRFASPKNTHFSVCILLKKGGIFNGSDVGDADGDEEFLMYLILAGVDLREEDEVCWKFSGGEFNEVIEVCEPPIPCLKRTRVDKEEKLCCSICLEDLVAGSDAAKTTTCGHVYHCHCVVQWLSKNSSCPLCRCRLHY